MGAERQLSLKAKPPQLKTPLLSSAAPPQKWAASVKTCPYNFAAVKRGRLRQAASLAGASAVRAGASAIIQGLRCAAAPLHDPPQRVCRRSRPLPPRYLAASPGRAVGLADRSFGGQNLSRDAHCEAVTMPAARFGGRSRARQFVFTGESKASRRTQAADDVRLCGGVSPEASRQCTTLGRHSPPQESLSTTSSSSHEGAPPARRLEPSAHRCHAERASSPLSPSLPRSQA